MPMADDFEHTSSAAGIGVKQPLATQCQWLLPGVKADIGPRIQSPAWLNYCCAKQL